MTTQTYLNQETWKTEQTPAEILAWIEKRGYTAEKGFISLELSYEDKKELLPNLTNPNLMDSCNVRVWFINGQKIVKTFKNGKVKTYHFTKYHVFQETLNRYEIGSHWDRR